ncbi:MAG: MarR family transcriptional regulator [Dehalococcoidia bacterium]
MVKKRGTAEASDYRKYVPFMGREYNMFMLIGLTLNAIFNARHNQVKNLGLTPAEFHLLLLVSELGGTATPGKIAQWMMRKPPTISGLLNRMEKSGLVVRRGYRNNKKLRKVIITPKGQEALAHLSNEKDILNIIVNSLSKAEYERLWAMLEKLRETALSLAGEAESAEEVQIIPIGKEFIG